MNPQGSRSSSHQFGKQWEATPFEGKNTPSDGNRFESPAWQRQRTKKGTFFWCLQNGHFKWVKSDFEIMGPKDCRSGMNLL